MPVKIRKTDHKYRVSTPGGVKAKGTTKAKAQSQSNLLRGIEHGWKPTGKKARKVKKAAKGIVVTDGYGIGPKQHTGPAPVGKPPVIRTTREVITGKR